MLHVYDLTFVSGSGADGDRTSCRRVAKPVTAVSTFVSVKPLDVYNPGVSIETSGYLQQCLW